MRQEVIFLYEPCLSFVLIRPIFFSFLQYIQSTHHITYIFIALHILFWDNQPLKIVFKAKYLIVEAHLSVLDFFFTKIFRMFFFLTTIHRPSLSLVNFPFMVPELCPHLLLYQRITFVYEYLDLHVQLNLVMYKTQSKRLMIFLRNVLSI